MRIFNQEKTQEILNPDMTQGYLKDDKLFIAHHAEVQAVKEVGHYEVIAEYPNGGKDVEWIVDVPAVEAHEAYDEYEDIKVFIPFTAAQLTEIKQNKIRARRRKECFSIINRGALWYEKLTIEQRAELSAWYEAWLNAPQTLEMPETPVWLK